MGQQKWEAAGSEEAQEACVEEEEYVYGEEWTWELRAKYVVV